MPARFFGQFLLERGVVTGEALLTAIEYQSSHNLKLGELAVREGLLTQGDADQINREQRRQDAQFGQVALSLNKLTPDQIDRLAAKQKQSHIFIGEALVAVQAIGKAQLAEELAAYKQEQDRDRLQAVEAMNAIPWAVGPTYATLVQLTARLLRRVADIITKEGASREHADRLPAAEVQVAVGFTGGWQGEFILRLPAALARRIASRMLDEAQPSPELVIDAVKEFANIACGQMCAALSVGGAAHDLSAPRELPGGREVSLPEHQIAVFPLHTADGTIEIAAAVRR